VLACYRRDARTLSSSNESSKMSLLECIVFSMGQSNTPESNISGFGWAVKEQARPLFMGVFAHRSDVPFINLSTHIFESRYYNKTFRCLLTATTISRNMSSKNWLKYYHDYM
jgi:hypothetical protein